MSDLIWKMATDIYESVHFQLKYCIFMWLRNMSENWLVENGGRIALYEANHFKNRKWNFSRLLFTKY